MQGARPARIAEQIREELGALVTRGVKDPGLGLITFTHARVSADLQVAHVYYTALGSERDRRETARALERAAPYLRRQVAGRLRLRRAPELIFHYDEHVARVERVEELFKQIHDEPRSAEPGPDTGGGDPDAG
jgi:ribosome-binding factor A